MALQVIGAKDKKGSIFFLCLWSLCLLGIFAVGLGSRVSQEINLTAYFQDKPAARYLAEVAIKKAQGILKSDLNTFDALNEFWGTGRFSDNEASIFEQAKLGSGTYSITSGAADGKYGLADEERKINLNTAASDVLERLLQSSASMSSDDAYVLANSIVDWRDWDNSPGEGGAEDNYYNFLERPYDCKDKNFQALEELLLVKGMTDEVFQTIKDSVTIFGDGKVNINTASPTVLFALGMNAALVEKIMLYRAGKDAIVATRDDNVFTDSAQISSELAAVASLTQEEQAKILELTLERLIGVTSKNFLIHAQGQVGRRREQIACISDKTGWIKYWREGY